MVEVLNSNQGCARFAEIYWAPDIVDFHNFTLQLPIHTLHYVTPELPVLESSLENCQISAKRAQPCRKNVSISWFSIVFIHPTLYVIYFPGYVCWNLLSDMKAKVFYFSCILASASATLTAHSPWWTHQELRTESISVSLQANQISSYT